MVNVNAAENNLRGKTEEEVVAVAGKHIIKTLAKVMNYQIARLCALIVMLTQVHLGDLEVND